MGGIKIGKETFEFDYSDMNTQAKYCDALDQYLAKAEKIDEKYKASKQTQRDRLEQFSGICAAVYCFVDTVFGEGIAVKALGESYNIDACIGVFEVINRAISANDQAISDRLSIK